MRTLFALLTFVPTIVFAAIINVAVGSPALTITPSSITAVPGDILTFQFTGEHTVTQSQFTTPCTQVTGFDSGFLNTGGSISLTVNDTNPIWLFCAVGRHCNLGMVAVVNPPGGGQTIDSFKAAAANAPISYGSPAQPSGSGSTTATTAPSTTKPPTAPGPYGSGSVHSNFGLNLVASVLVGVAASIVLL